jgi:hypothetical protein
VFTIVVTGLCRKFEAALQAIPQTVRFPGVKVPPGLPGPVCPAGKAVAVWVSIAAALGAALDSATFRFVLLIVYVFVPRHGFVPSLSTLVDSRVY